MTPTFRGEFVIAGVVVASGVATPSAKRSTDPAARGATENLRLCLCPKASGN